LIKKNDEINDTINFEDALRELEEIVKKMENGDLTLDESLTLFEQGITLTRMCSSKLEHAKQKIEILVKQNKIEEFKIE
jgi:exodeoxyribonuclease VII small subunit